MSESSFLHPLRVIRVCGLDEGMRVADFGAGSGFFTRAAAHEVGEDGVVWAVDINRELLPRIKNIATAEGLENVEVIHGDISVVEGSHLPTGSFDFVIVTNVLFSIEDKKEVVAEMRRVFTPSGRALVVDWSGSFGGLGPHETHVFTRREAQKLFESMGFVVVKEVPTGEYHWGFIVRKKSATSN